MPEWSHSSAAYLATVLAPLLLENVLPGRWRRWRSDLTVSADAAAAQLCANNIILKRMFTIRAFSNHNTDASRLHWAQCIMDALSPTVSSGAYVCHSSASAQTNLAQRVIRGLGGAARHGESSPYRSMSSSTPAAMCTGGKPFELETHSGPFSTRSAHRTSTPAASHMILMTSLRD